jgi:hypothetical protein
MERARKAQLYEQSLKGGAGEEVPRGCATERALEDSTRKSAPEALIFEQGVRVCRTDIGLLTSVARWHAGGDQVSKGSQTAQLYEPGPKGGGGEEAPRGCATERVLEGSTRQCAPEARLFEQGVGVRHADTRVLTSVAGSHAIRNQAKVSSLRSDWVTPGPWGYAQGGSRGGGVMPGTGCQSLSERELDDNFLCDEEEHPEGDEEGSEQQAGASFFTAPQYDRHMRRAVISTLRTVGSLYPMPEKERLLRKAP